MEDNGAFQENLFYLKLTFHCLKHKHNNSINHSNIHSLGLLAVPYFVSFLISGEVVFDGRHLEVGAVLDD